MNEWVIDWLSEQQVSVWAREPTFKSTSCLDFMVINFVQNCRCQFVLKNQHIKHIFKQDSW